MPLVHVVGQMGAANGDIWWWGGGGGDKSQCVSGGNQSENHTASPSQLGEAHVLVIKL